MSTDDLTSDSFLPDLMALPSQPRRVAEMSVVRQLTKEDLPALLDRPAPSASITTMRHQHHRLAQLLAQGNPPVAVSLLSGYSTGYIYNIQKDPAFAELLAFYQTQNAELFVDANERAKTLGLTALDELAKRLEEKPDEFAKRELLEIAQFGLAPGSAGRGGGASGPQVAVNVTFKSPEHQSEPPVLDITLIPPEAEI